MIAANENLMNELESLTDQLKQSRANNKEGDHILKIDQQQDGNLNFSVYFGDNLMYESSGEYKVDSSHTRYEGSCRNDHCKTTVEYGLIEGNAPGSKVRVEEKHDNQSDHFHVNLAFYDENGSAIGRYETELSYQQSQNAGFEGYNFIIHDLIAV